jgi:GT2 family glycosyltransferase
MTVACPGAVTLHRHSTERDHNEGGLALETCRGDSCAMDMLIHEKTARVTVVVPNWNGRELLSTVCLPALARQTFRDFSVLVVDNGSVDASAEYVRTSWPDVRLLELPENKGFAAAVNRGIDAAGTPLIALLNNDVEPAPTWLEELVEALSLHPSAGSVVGKLLDFHDRELIGTTGEQIGRTGALYSRGAGERDAGQYDAGPVFSACAGAALYRADAFHGVGGFDEDFFAYHEDADWGFRAQLLGYGCWFTPAAVAYHMRHGTSGSMGGFRRASLARNGCWLVVKNFPNRVIARNVHRIAYVVLQRYYRLWRDGHRRLAAGAAWSTLRLLPRMLRKRRGTYAARRVDDDQIQALMLRDMVGSVKLMRMANAYARLRPRRATTP